MNDRKFLGLLNLYLDGEIDPDSATVLEREIHSNPRRRQIYGDYCRIHRATRLIYERFRNAAAEQGAAGLQALRPQTLSPDNHAAGQARTVARDRGLVRTAVYWMGGVAAACAAAYAVFLYAPRTAAPEATTPVVEAPLAVATPPTTAAPPPAREVTTTTTVPENATAPVGPIAAPFATEFRLDPFVADRPFERRSPFSFSSQPAGNNLVGFEPAPVSAFFLQQQDERKQTSLQGLNLEPAQADAADSRVFREPADDQPVTLEPVGYQIQR